jgi:hypothetical protein
MQSAAIRTFQLIVIAVLFASGASAGDIRPEQFDLLCQGTISRAGVALDAGSTFTKRLRVDLKREAFCDDKLCGNLVSKDGVSLEYHCDAKKLGYPCLPEGEGGNNGGPFIFLDDLVFGRSGGSFLRQVVGSVGDANPHPFSETYLGSCGISAFTGLTYSPDPEK